MDEYYNRYLEKKILKLAKSFPVILLTGARQVGKTTLLHYLFGEKFPFYTFDPVTDIHHIREDPYLFLKQFDGPVIFDEIQYALELLPAIKVIVDQKREKGLYFLTGSQDFSLLKNVSESLAGRTVIISLRAMSLAERIGHASGNWVERLINNPKEPLLAALKGYTSANKGKNVFKTLWRGGMPGILELEDDLLPDFFRSYIQTYIERDIRQLADISSLQTFSRFLGICAAQTAQEINMSQFGREISVTPQTASRWIDLLAGTFLWVNIPPYSGNVIKKVSKKPKGYISDTGLACYFSYISSSEALFSHPLRGYIFETHVVMDLLAQISMISLQPAFYYWRSRNGAEVDLIMERDGFFWLFEIKSGTNITKKYCSGFNAFKKTYPQLNIAGEYIIAPVAEISRLTENCWIVPYDLIC